MSQEQIEKDLKKIDEEGKEIQIKMQELSDGRVVGAEDYKNLREKINTLLELATKIDNAPEISLTQKIKVLHKISDFKKQIAVCDDKLGDNLNQSIAQAPQPAATGKLTPQEGIAEMQRLLDEAKQTSDKKVRFDNQNRVMSITNRVAMVDQNPEYIQKLQSVLREFKSLNTAAAVVSQSTSQQQNAKDLYQAPLSGHAANEFAQDLQSKATVPPADVLSVDEKSGAVEAQLPAGAQMVESQPVVQGGGVAVEAKVDEGALPAKGLDKSAFKAQLQEIATENNWGIASVGNAIRIQDKNETVSILPSHQGMKISGSAELGSNVLDKWCDKNKFDKLDVKISMPTVGKNIDSKSAEGDAAWKAFSTYNQKGFYVKDFPIDNFKDKPNYQQMKQQYEGMKEQVAAKQMTSPKMSG